MPRIHIEESLAVARKVAEANGDQQRVVGSLWGMVQVALAEGEIEAALAYAEESLALARAPGTAKRQGRDIAWSLAQLGNIAEARVELSIITGGGPSPRSGMSGIWPPSATPSFDRPATPACLNDDPLPPRCPVTGIAPS